MTGTALERLLGRDRAIVATALAVITALAWVYVFRLAADMEMGGMRMDGIGGMGGGAAPPGGAGGSAGPAISAVLNASRPNVIRSLPLSVGPGQGSHDPASQAYSVTTAFG